jgi:hypothetical protein
MTMRHWPIKKALTTLGVIALAAAPFLALQGVLNVGLTGRVFQSPYRLYCDLFTPQMTFGFHKFDPTLKPKTNLLQRQIYYEEFTVPAARDHRPELIWQTWTKQRLPQISALALPSPLLLILVPCGLLEMGRRRWVMAGVLPLFVAFYVFFAYLLSFYVMVIAPALIFVVLLGYTAICDNFARLRPWLTFCMAVLIVLLAVRALPEFNRLVRDDTMNMPVMTFDHHLSQWVRQPALVLYRFDRSDATDGEPVYNVDVAWPDDAPIIRAQDLSPQQNRELLEYYALRQPDRQVYRVDRAKVAEPTYRPEYLGTAAELFAKPAH